MKLRVRFLVVSAILGVGLSLQAQWANNDPKITTNCATPPCLVGIGEPNPYAPLVVRGTSAAASIGAKSQNSASIQGSNNVDVSIGTDPGSPYGAWIQVKHTVINFAYPMLLQPVGGDVGIGTRAPYARLQVVGPAAPPSTTRNTAAVLSVMGSNNVDLSMGTDTANAYGAWIQAKHNTMDYAYPLLLQPAGGNVGIGTSAPTQKLEVQSSPDGAHNVIVSTPMATNFAVNSPIGGLRLSWKFGQYAPNNVDFQVIRGAGATDGAGLSIATSPNNTTGPVERLKITAAGNVGIGEPNPTVALQVNGEIRGTKVTAHYQDVAEWVPSREDLAPGTVVTLDPNVGNSVQASTMPYDTSVAGVVSAEPGIILGIGGASKEQVATTGRVRVKVDASRGAIRVGDLLVTSDRAGYAMRSVPVDMGGIAMHRPGTIVGKALEPLAEGQGEILVLLSLQ